MQDELRKELRSARRKPKDLLDRHQLVVMDDREKFEGMNSAELRMHFSEWAMENSSHDCCPQEDKTRAGRGILDLGHSAGARYNFFLVIDAVCLESLEKRKGVEPVVKLLAKDSRLNKRGKVKLKGAGKNTYIRVCQYAGLHNFLD